MRGCPVELARMQDCIPQPARIRGCRSSRNDRLQLALDGGVRGQSVAEALTKRQPLAVTMSSAGPCDRGNPCPPPRGRAADSQDRMDQPIADRLCVIGCEEVNRTAVEAQPETQARPKKRWACPGHPQLLPGGCAAAGDMALGPSSGFGTGHCAPNGPRRSRVRDRAPRSEWRPEDRRFSTGHCAPNGSPRTEGS
jgi:hypothetical protein